MELLWQIFAIILFVIGIFGLSCLLWFCLKKKPRNSQIEHDNESWNTAPDLVLQNHTLLDIELQSLEEGLLASLNSSQIECDRASTGTTSSRKRPAPQTPPKDNIPVADDLDGTDGEEGFEDNELIGNENEKDLERHDVELMRRALDKFTMELKDWNALCPGDQKLKVKYDALNDHGVKFFWQLIEMLYKRVCNEGVDRFCNLNKDFIWNFSTWLRVILKLASGVNTDPSTPNCLLSSSSISSEAHTIMSFSIGRYTFVDTKAHSSKLGKVKFCANKSTQFCAARVVCALNRGCPKAGEEASHRCINMPQTCIDPDHLEWESKQINLTRTGCQTYGCALRCKHTPKCIYTDKEGKWLPCLNSNTFSDCRCLDQYCNTADILGKVEVTDLAPKVELAKANCKCRYKECQVKDKKIANKSIRITAGPQNNRKFWHIRCYSLENPTCDMKLLPVIDDLKGDFDEALNGLDEQRGDDVESVGPSTLVSLTNTHLRHATLAEYDKFTEWLDLEPVTADWKPYKLLLSHKLTETLLVLNQGGILRLFAKYGRTNSNYFCCYKCQEHSKKPNATIDRIARVQISLNRLSITQATHHPDCTPLTEREVVFQEFDRQCRKLVKNKQLDHILAYEKARMFCFHYHYETTNEEPVFAQEDNKSLEKRARVERDPKLLPSYDLTRELDGFFGRNAGIGSYRALLSE